MNNQILLEIVDSSLFSFIVNVWDAAAKMRFNLMVTSAQNKISKRISMPFSTFEERLALPFFPKSWDFYTMWIHAHPKGWWNASFLKPLSMSTSWQSRSGSLEEINMSSTLTGSGRSGQWCYFQVDIHYHKVVITRIKLDKYYKMILEWEVK